MPLTINQIIKQAAIDVGLEEPTGTLVTSTDKDVKQLIQHAVTTGRQLRAKYKFPQLKKTYIFSTSNGRSQYTLPSDFFAMIPETHWDRSNSWAMAGPMQDSEYNYYTLGVALGTNRKIFKIFGANENLGQFYIYPTPTAVESISFDYIRAQWFLPKAWTASEAGITSGSTYRSASGNIYLAASTGTSGTTYPSHTSGSASDGTLNWTYDTDQLYGSGDKFADDNDFALIDDDLILLGTVWRFLKRKGLDYGEEKLLYDNECGRRYARLKGAQTLYLGDGPVGGGVINFPDGDFNI